VTTRAHVAYIVGVIGVGLLINLVLMALLDAV